MWATPCATENGQRVESMSSKDGTPPRVGELVIDRRTGRTVGDTIGQQVRFPNQPPREAWEGDTSRLIEEPEQHHADRLRCLGNAVVPQVAEFVGRQIVELAS